MNGMAIFVGVGLLISILTVVIADNPGNKIAAAVMFVGFSILLCLFTWMISKE